MTDKQRIEELVKYLNICCDEYYNKNNPTLSDAQYDALFDELSALEKKTGYVLPNSPTVRAGYEVLSSLKKVTHDIPLLSLAKTKSAAEVYSMAKENDGYLALKLDGLTVKITYENGEITAAATRGDGAVGEDITHNAKVFVNIPKKIPYTEKLVVSGEAFIDIPTFERINEQIENDEEKYSTPRNLASGSVRQLDSAICAARGVSFIPFSVLEGFSQEDSKPDRLKKLASFGFELIPNEPLTADDSEASTEEKILKLKEIANQKGYPIDGIVFSFSSVSYGRTLGRTSHHFKDGIAYKFGDPHFETTLKNIIWNISRTGQLTPIAEFNPVEIDNTNVERASLHNVTFIENLKLEEGDKILVSKRNMIIPHVEENVTAREENRENYILKIPEKCPVCHKETTIKTTQNGQDTVQVLFCANKDCAGRQIKKFTHFVSKTALDIEGLSEATLIRFIEKGFINSLADIFALPEKRDEIVKMEGFGEKSYENLVSSIQKAKTTSLSRLLVAININLLGKSGAKLIEDHFGGDVSEFKEALKSGFDFTELDGIGEIMNGEIYSWYNNADRQKEFEELLNIITVEKSAAAFADQNGYFYGKTIVITGKFSTLSRDSLTEKMVSLGAKVTGSVSGKTDFLLCGEDAGSKLSKAQKLGVKILTEQELKEFVEI
ncbi:MAG: NAD-dependent DNA ligase LigA [Clostridiales bacterium]|nr:NAD-dependent DNA ligase LigA [Candidatus Equinaster intestinalis]